MAEKKRGAQGGGTIRKKTVTRNGQQYTYWEARITTGRDAGTGKQIQRSFSGKTQAEVRKKMLAAAVEIDSGTYQEPSKLTLAEWLAIWQRDYLGAVKPYTVQNYAQQINAHIVPHLGSIKLEALNAHTIQGFYNRMVKEGGRVAVHGKDGKVLKKNGKTVYATAPLSPKTVKNIHGVLHKALQQAVKVGYLHFNPADACELPRIERKDIKPLDNDGISAFLREISGHRFEDVYLVMLFTGIRRGEACGLLWECVDFEKGTIRIDKQLQAIPSKAGEFRLLSTKNGKGRTITAASFVMDILRRRNVQQKEDKLKAGSAWQDDGYVFTNEIGEHISPHTLYHNYKRIAAAIGLPDARLHDLRHSYAVAALQAGDDIKTVQGNLGHHAAAFTLDTYAHVTEQMKRDSADRMDAFIKGVSNL